MNPSPPGPGVLNQVVTAATFYGHVARCGCGWKAVHETGAAAEEAGGRHLLAAHSPAGCEREGDAA